MKQMSTLLALLLSCSMLAQGPVEFPWNPDADGDDFIGVNDLMALLGEYSTSFSEENLYLSEDSLSATYFVGQMNYFDCNKACRNLPGKWKMWGLEDLDTAPDPNFAWIQTAAENWYLISNQFSTRFKFGDEISYANPFSTGEYAQCYCVTKERPKVEYFLCSTDQPGQLQNCVSDKVGDGWVLLGAPMYANEAGNAWNQALWRWAE